MRNETDLKPESEEGLEEEILDISINTDLFEGYCEFETPVKLEESNSDVDGEYIIGRAVGECFFLNRSSRNKRFYSDSLWEKVLKDGGVKKKLDSRTMYGTIGHDQEIDEKAIREGKISHIVNKLWIDGKKGFGEFLILNTDSGRIINTLLKAKSEVSFSTRAKGSYSGNAPNGDKAVDPNRFRFKTVDFVLDPGFLDAQPSLVEELSSIYKEDDSDIEDLVEVNSKKEFETKNDITEKSNLIQTKIIEDISMDATQNEFIDHLKEENTSVKEERDVLIKESQDKQSELSDLQEKLDLANKELSESNEKEISEKAVVAETAFNEMKEDLAAYKAIGTSKEFGDMVESHKETVSKVDTLTEEKSLSKKDSKIAADKLEEAVTSLAKYEALGTVSDLQESIKNGENNISDDIVEAKDFIKSNGSVKEVSEKLKNLETLVGDQSVEEAVSSLAEHKDIVSEYGSKTEISEAFESMLNVFEEIGTPEEVNTAFDSIEEMLEDLGTPEEISEAMDLMTKFLESNGGYDVIVSKLKDYDDLVESCGSPEDIERALDLSITSLTEIKESKLAEETAEFSKEIGVEESVVAKLFNKDFDKEEIAEMFGKRYKSTSIDESNTNEDKPKEESRFVKRSSASYLMEGNSADETREGSLEESLSKSTKSRASMLMS